MCRNIKPLFNYDPPATNDEIRASCLQFVRKVSGTTKPSIANEAAFDGCVIEVETAVRALLDSLVTSVSPKNREVEAAKAQARTARRSGGTSQRLSRDTS